MEIRLLKIVLLLLVSLQGIIYATQNIVNLDAAYATLAYVMGQQEHVAYPVSAIPDITSPALIWFGVCMVLLGEYGSGILGLIGVKHLWSSRCASPAAFNGAKKYGILGCGLAVVTWLGLFLVIGGAAFQMWQTEIGQQSFQNSYVFVGTNSLVMIFLNMED